MAVESAPTQGLKTMQTCAKHNEQPFVTSPNFHLLRDYENPCTLTSSGESWNGVGAHPSGAKVMMEKMQFTLGLHSLAQKNSQKNQTQDNSARSTRATIRIDFLHQNLEQKYVCI